MKIRTSCWICGKTVMVEGEEGEWGDETKWVTCEECMKSGRVRVTGGEARRTDRRMKRVYVCGPFAGKDQAEENENTYKAMKAAMGIGKEHTERGEERPLIFVPHLMFEYVDEKEEREWALQMCEEVVVECDEVVVRGKRRTEGMRRDLEAAERAGVKVIEREDL